MKQTPNEHEALVYHSTPPHGKTGTQVTKSLRTPHDLALAYSPGVALPVRAIAERPETIYRYTNKGNLIAVISNGTAILGLGNQGPEASKPVMEGKCMLLKGLAGIDAIDLEVRENDPDRLVDLIAALEPGLGGIILEDVKAPECFYIERELSARLSIPLLHDDQHGTAVVVAAAVLNGLKVVGKQLEKLHVVINGAGAAAIGCAHMLLAMGLPAAQLVMCDSQGVITHDRPLLSDLKRRYATSRRIHTLAEALVDADLFIGVSKGGLLTPAMVATMALNPMVFALANPDPELPPALVSQCRPDMLYATGRSDVPNQVNNVLGFPYLLRGALDTQAMRINDAMLQAAAKAIAALAEEEIPNELLRLYNSDHLTFGRTYLLPKALDPRLYERVSTAVAQAAIRSGVARHTIEDWDAYHQALQMHCDR